jgi:hypothetical protein
MIECKARSMLVGGSMSVHPGTAVLPPGGVTTAGSGKSLAAFTTGVAGRGGMGNSDRENDNAAILAPGRCAKQASRSRNPQFALTE